MSENLNFDNRLLVAIRAVGSSSANEVQDRDEKNTENQYTIDALA